MSPPNGRGRSPKDDRPPTSSLLETPASYSGPPPWGTSFHACPDCAATAVDPRLTHDATCPHGAAQAAADRAWFEAHPRAYHRRRPIMPAEVTDLRLAGYLPDDGWTAVGDIEVTRLAPPGVPARSHPNIRIVPLQRAT